MIRYLLAAVVIAFPLSSADAGQRYHEREREDPPAPSVEYVPAIWTPKDIDSAIALAEDATPKDVVGATCWKTWKPAAMAMENHRLPKVPITAVDLQVARLVSLARKALQADQNCAGLLTYIQGKLDPVANSSSAMVAPKAAWYDR